jgi:type IV pilus assembly protein PilM
LINYVKSQVDAEISVINPLKEFEIKDESDQINKHFMAAAAGTIISEVMHNES